MAIMATLASAIMMREIRAFIGASYQPLVMVSGATVILLAAPVVRTPRKPTILVGSVGCTTCSASP